MTHKEIAERLRTLFSEGEETISIAQIEKSMTEALQLADELDPPRPEPGTVVWWRFDDTDWEPGIVFDKDSIVDKDSKLISFYQGIEWKPARILADNEVALSADLWHAIRYAVGWKTISEIAKLVDLAELERTEVKG